MTQLKNRPSSAKRKIESNADTYVAYGFVLILICVAMMFGANFGVKKLNSYQIKLQEIENRYNFAVQRKEVMTRRLEQAAQEMQEVGQRAERWKQAESRIQKPWATSIPNWLALSLRDQPLPLMDEGTMSQSGGPDKLQIIEMQLSGEFQSLLNWMMRAEHELDMVRIIKANWQARNTGVVGLTVTIEVNYE